MTVGVVVEPGGIDGSSVTGELTGTPADAGSAGTVTVEGATTGTRGTVPMSPP